MRKGTMSEYGDAVSHEHAPQRLYTVEFQWLEHLWNHENMFGTGVVRANEC